MYAFELERPTTLADALKALGGEEAQPLSGGQTLIPTLKQRLAMPSTLVSLTGIDETSTSDDILSALFAASARMEAEMGADGAAVDAAVSRMELYILSTCGESTAGLFELLGGVTGPPAQA